MNIYFSKKIDTISFFGDSVSFYFDKPITKLSCGLSFVVFCIYNEINDIEKIANELVKKFNIIDDICNVKETILCSTVGDEDVKSAFTLDVKNSNNSINIYGMMGKRYPRTLHMELTGTCNFQCSHCYKNAKYKGKYVEFNWIKEKIYEEFKHCIPIIHLTGGEPTLHSDFSKIVNLFNDCYILQLTTNGSNIISFSVDLFKKFQAIDISLYGLTSDEYFTNTGDAAAFERVKAGCNMLSKSNIDFRLTLVINNDNWHQMEDYVRFAISIGATKFGFALPSNGGKLLLNTPDKWHLNAETKRKIYRKLRFIQNNYEGEINITEWDRTNYSDMWKSYPEDDSLRCGAGSKDWWMSENYTFRPCSFLPEQYVNLNYAQWYEYITNVKDIDWTEARESLELFASKNNRRITDFCSIFRRYM